MQPDAPTPPSAASRRDFLAASAALSVSAWGANSPLVHAGGSEILKVGLIGCGGRGTGAASDAMRADPGVRLVALGDVFADRLSSSRKTLVSGHGAQVQVTDERCFVGFDAYQKVIDCCDVVLLATPPHFRPRHLAAAVAAGKHIFCEKPVAVDAPGVRSVLESTAKAKQKNLNLVSGLCYRYCKRVKEVVQQVRDGAIGKVVALQCNYNTGGLWSHERQATWTDMEYQLRNWLYYTWLSGDHNVEQHIHSLDKMAWIMNDEPPVKCFGLGGRQARTDAKYGHIFDHHAVCHEYANGVRLFSYCRQQVGTDSEVADYIFGSAGSASMDAFRYGKVTGAKPWNFRLRRGEKDDMYLQEHQALFAAIRSGTPINNGDYMAKSTMLAIMGRMATYTGKVVEWEKALNATEDLTPTAYEFGALPFPTVAIPGTTKLV